ncbi:hypothetical protein EYF80_045928 [Liparis tanakae]|uniref:Uncharacterized protein n=1 Tax=Liparis tanakae TaxID=230148 RepID=A0A4Z2FT35_9TELE|nr:hypothetical protein EYF80_045928 [Liparis tanakae]
MERRRRWLGGLTDELSGNPVASNVAFGFVLVGLEKLMELEFKCPCSPRWNAVFSSTFFVIPAVMAFTLMLIVQGCRGEGRGRGGGSTASLSCVVPAVVWLILLFLDGQYFVCAMTDWEGRFVIVDKAAPQKCMVEEFIKGFRPFKRAAMTLMWPMVIGIVLLVFICVGLMVYVIRGRCEEELEEADVALHRIQHIQSGPSSERSGPPVPRRPPPPTPTPKITSTIF